MASASDFSIAATASTSAATSASDTVSNLALLCSALQRLSQRSLCLRLSSTWLGLPQLGMIKLPKVWIISFCNVLLPPASTAIAATVPCLCSCLCPSPSPCPCPCRCPLWLLLCRLHLLPAAVAVVLRVMNKFAQFVK